MEERPIVAIQCLVYNHEPYLRQCLDGFVMQKTNFKFVAIVHDDCSTDGSSDIIREYVQHYPKIIKPIFETENQYTKKNGALRRIVDRALKETGAKYIALCEGDDYWIDPLKLQKQVDFLESHPDIGLCYSDYRKFYHETQYETESDFRSNPEGTPFTTNLDEWLIRPRYMAPPTWLAKSSLWFKSTLCNSVDGTLVRFTYFLAYSQVHCMENDITAVYRILDESASHSASIKKIYARTIGLYSTQLELANICIENTIRRNEILFNIRRVFYKLHWKLLLAKGDRESLSELHKWKKTILSSRANILCTICMIDIIRTLFGMLYICYLKKRLHYID